MVLSKTASIRQDNAEKYDNGDVKLQNNLSLVSQDINLINITLRGEGNQLFFKNLVK